MLHIACKSRLDKTVETHQTSWNAVLRQAVIRVKPDYFALSEAEREHYRLQLNVEDDFRIRQIVLKELFGIAVNTCPWRIVILTETICCNVIDKLPSRRTGTGRAPGY
jgi:hypothetical protein